MPKATPIDISDPVSKHFSDTRPHATAIEPDFGGPIDPAHPLDWDHALEAAAARLIESSIAADTIAHMEASGQANEFAATLCAYGLLAGEVEHMHRRDDATVLGQLKIAV